ncbi:C4-dicarboxylate transporter/malic acid transport protein [Psychromonas sp. CNPT3]|uniref:TDT family transporter n=1 Tax=Psychromonas sp. CNPT3 TaxID=314282 RepID=UPI00006E42A4|nr:TDT family transporter [Psychromonas sp. CNPT3]AGH80883.1 C4-dicarboxylate transporter/malic acid transport protein [Psychromonas sp. CNPT3]
MIKKIKIKLSSVPTPMAGLALGIASLGWSWENIAHLHGVGQWTSAMIASVLLIILALKFLLLPSTLKEDLSHPVIGSVIPTFTMAIMIVSNSLGQFFPRAGDILWLCAIGLHIVFLMSFIYYRAKSFELHDLLPSWFVPPVGIIVASVSFSGDPQLYWVAHSALIFGMLAYAVMLPIMLYRFIFTFNIADSAKPTLAILAAPASLSLAGYFTLTTDPSPMIIALLFGIAVLMTSVTYLALLKLLRLPFSPGYAAFTFPLVIGATALFKMVAWMQSKEMLIEYIQQIRLLAIGELFIATIIVIYVAIRYLYFYRPKATPLII